MRVPLVDLCLQVKVLELGSIAMFLDKAIDPPKEEAVTTSIDTLKEVCMPHDSPPWSHECTVVWSPCFCYVRSRPEGQLQPP